MPCWLPMGPRKVRVHAPGAARVELVVEGEVVAGGCGERRAAAARRDGGWWTVEVDAVDGERYRIEVDGGPPLVDPHARDVVVTADGPRAVFREPGVARERVVTPPSAPVVYELHVKGFGASYLGCIERLDHLVSLGVDVIELMPVHPFDDRSNYWGYMPIVWGAVHRGYAHDQSHAAEELASLVAAAHSRGLSVWLDVVFNHTAESLSSPSSLLGLGDPSVYRRDHEGRPTDDSGCGNDIDPAHPYVRELILEALDRFVDLGIDGFRFDLASLLTRDGGGLVDEVTAWAARRGVSLVAEAWDLAAYQVGHGWPWPTWRQWNDRFRDDVRSFLRGEPGYARATRLRIEGSPDLFGAEGRGRTVNFVTAHDGLTLHDLTTTDSDRHRAWNCGDELRLQQLKNYFAVLLLSAGTAMWVMGDEFGRTQYGHDNPYDVDGPQSWVDWSTRDAWSDLTAAVRTLVALRRAHPPTTFTFHGVGPEPDEGFESRSLAWCSNGLYVMINAWWEPLSFEVQRPGEWHRVFESAHAQDDGLCWTVAPRSVVVLESAE